MSKPLESVVPSQADVEGVVPATDGLAEQAGFRTARLPEQTAVAASVSTRVIIGRILAVAVPVFIWFWPFNLDATPKHALAITSFMIIGWMTEALDHALTGLIGCFLFWALGVVKVNTAFSGFANDTCWLLFGALLFGMMATKSGLARRLAYLVMLKVGTSYARILLGLILSDFLLTLLVPSGMARIVVMAAVALGLMEA